MKTVRFHTGNRIVNGKWETIIHVYNLEDLPPVGNSIDLQFDERRDCIRQHGRSNYVIRFASDR